MISELPASALYTSPPLGRLWKKVHLACSPFLRRPAIRRLYQEPARLIRKRLQGPYSLIALGCADGTKEALLLKKLSQPKLLVAADTNLSLARRAARRLPARKKSACRIDLTRHLPTCLSRIPRPRLFTLFGVLPNLDPLPLLRRVAKKMPPHDLLLFSANLAPGRSGLAGALQVLPQYDNLPTRLWLEASVKRFRPKLPKGELKFGVSSDPRQKSLARIEARWVTPTKTFTVFSSRRPTLSQVEQWIRLAGLRKIRVFLDPCGEEAVWMVKPAK